jgi:hypothetical protein
MPKNDGRVQEEGAGGFKPSLDPAEAAVLSAKSIELGQELGHALSKSSDGGARVTKAEAKGILKLAASLVATLAVDIID